MKCPICFSEYRDSDSFCPFCKHEAPSVKLAELSTKNKHRVLYIGAAVLSLFLIMGLTIALVVSIGSKGKGGNTVADKSSVSDSTLPTTTPPLKQTTTDSTTAIYSLFDRRSSAETSIDQSRITLNSEIDAQGEDPTRWPYPLIQRSNEFALALDQGSHIFTSLSGEAYSLASQSSYQKELNQYAKDLAAYSVLLENSSIALNNLVKNSGTRTDYDATWNTVGEGSKKLQEDEVSFKL